jgi:hypothetical protein
MNQVKTTVWVPHAAPLLSRDPLMCLLGGRISATQFNESLPEN